MKKLILIRHAHRDTQKRELDNGLSSKGEKQVRDLIRFFRARRSEEKESFQSVNFLSSPKLRCVETLRPWAEAWGGRVLKDVRLLELQGGEGFGDLMGRVENFTQSLVARPTQETTIVCSHGDWLPECLFHLVGHRIELKKAGFAEIDVDGGSARLRWVVQGCKIFR